MILHPYHVIQCWDSRIRENINLDDICETVFGMKFTNFILRPIVLDWSRGYFESSPRSDTYEDDLLVRAIGQTRLAVAWDGACKSWLRRQ